MVLGFGIWKGIFGVHIYDVSLAFCCILQPFKGEGQDVPFQLLCHGAGCNCQYGGFDAGIVSLSSSEGDYCFVLWDFFARTLERNLEAFLFLSGERSRAKGMEKKT